MKQKMKQKKTLYGQQGTVLVIAVFIASVIIAIAARFTSGFQLSVARTEQSIVNAQLQQFLYSIEDFSSWVLIEDAEADDADGNYIKNGVYASYDHLQERWATSIDVPIDDAKIEASLEDALSRFNLNQLQGRPSPYSVNGLFVERYTTAQQRFIRLLQTHPDGIDVSLAEEIMQAVIDWVDPDSAPTGQGGAENNYYESLDPSYRAANRFFISVTELRQVKGITNEIYSYMEPLLIALPNAEGFNINTASLALIRSLNQPNVETPLTEQDAVMLVSNRPLMTVVGSTSDLDEPPLTEAYESVEDFLTSNEASQVFGGDPIFWPSVNGLRTGSEYFILTAKVSMLDYQRSQISIIKRESTTDSAKSVKTKVIRRTREQL
ncbi:MAG: general secretion pathway protein K [Granulosicoccus sp.]|jgi:general secretion pathway protein K